MSADILDQRTFKILVSLVLLLAAPVLWSWFSPSDLQTTAMASTSAQSKTPSRGLASVVSSPGNTQHNRLSRPVTLDWDLSSPSLEKEIQGTHLRLKGLVKGLKTSSVKNETNGFTASVFLTGAEFTTDFIELNEGQNQITVQGTDGHGKYWKKILDVTRREPASAQN